MPYSGPNDPDLPSNVRKLSAKLRRMWVHIWNSVYKKTGDEAAAFRQANGVIKKMQNKMLEALEKVRGLFKAVWTTAYVNDLPDSAFLFVEAGEKDSEGKTVPRSLRHLPVRDANGKVDAAHVRNAIARANQIKLKSGARISEAKANALKAKAQRLLAQVSGKMIGGFKIIGEDKWVAWYTNAFEDRDLDEHGKGEIFEKQALEDSADWANARGKYAGGQKRMPQLWMAHIPIKWGDATFLENVDLYNIAAGTIDSTPIAQYFKGRLAGRPMTVSHAYNGLRRGRYYKKVRTIEISPLAPAWAANLSTLFMEVAMSDNAKVKALAETLGIDEEIAESMVKAAEEASERQREAGVEWKMLEEKALEEETEVEPEVEAEGADEQRPDPLVQLHEALTALLTGQKAIAATQVAIVQDQQKQVEAQKTATDAQDAAQKRFEALEGQVKKLSDTMSKIDLPFAAFEATVPQKTPPVDLGFKQVDAPPEDGVAELTKKLYGGGQGA